MYFCNQYKNKTIGHDERIGNISDRYQWSDEN